MTAPCSQCGKEAPWPVLRIVVVRCWRLIAGRWHAELVNLLDPGERLCRVCEQKRREAGIEGPDERRKNQGSG